MDQVLEGAPDRNRAFYRKIRESLDKLERRKLILPYDGRLILFLSENYEQMYDELRLELSDPNLTEIPKKLAAAMKDTPHARLIDLYTACMLAKGNGKPSMGNPKEKISAVNLLKHHTYAEIKPMLVMMIFEPTAFEYDPRKALEKKGPNLETLYFHFQAMNRQLDPLRHLYGSKNSVEWWQKHLRKHKLERFIDG